MTSCTVKFLLAPTQIFIFQKCSSLCQKVIYTEKKSSERVEKENPERLVPLPPEQGLSVSLNYERKQDHRPKKTDRGETGLGDVGLAQAGLGDVGLAQKKREKENSKGASLQRAQKSRVPQPEVERSELKGVAQDKLSMIAEVLRNRPYLGICEVVATMATTSQIPR